jgi:hypothetical protein
MLYQLSYCPRMGTQRISRPCLVTRDRSARLLVNGVPTIVAAVLAHLEPLSIIDFRLHRDVVPPFALGAFEGDLHPLVAFGHTFTRFVSRAGFGPRWLTTSARQII